jgi:hypothetical protein
LQARRRPCQAVKGKTSRGIRERSLPPETLGREPQLPGRLAPAHTRRWSDRKYRTVAASISGERPDGLPRGSKRRERALAARERGGSARPLEVCPQRRVLFDGLTDKSIGEALLRSGDGETCFKAAPATQLPASTGSGAATFQLASLAKKQSFGPATPRATARPPSRSASASVRSWT